MSFTFTADDFTDPCSVCKKPIWPDQRVTYDTPDSQLRHEGCVPPDVES